MLARSIFALAIGLLTAWDDDSTGLDAGNRAWVARQRQKLSGVSCCGDADMYFADAIKVIPGDGAGQLFAVITDTRPDAPLNREHRDVGTMFEVPTARYNDARRDPNLTGHGIIFIGHDPATLEAVVLCYFDNGGI